MAKRRSIRKVRKDKLIFSKTADRTRSKNMFQNPRPMRGGYRL